MGDLPGHTPAGTTPEPTLEKAIRDGDLRAVQSLVTSKNVNTPDPSGQSPLYLATAGLHPNIVQLLLENKAKVNDGIHADSFCTSPLHRAASEGSVEIAQLLLSK